MSNKTRKSVPWKGWSKLKPTGEQKTKMYYKCGKKCFLGNKTSKNRPGFPICSKGTCNINDKGLYAAYIRARQWGKPKKSYKGKKPRHAQKTYKRIASKAKRMLKKRGYKVGARKTKKTKKTKKK
jgi:hypothetical protein